jgi:hypothetical protein
MWKLTLAFLLLGCPSASSSACFATIDDVDMTEELFVLDSPGGGGYLNCTGIYRCKDAIMSCDKIHCDGSESCKGAVAEFTESMTCSGLHSCHYANMTHSPTSNTKVMEPASVLCEGNGSCDVAIIDGPEQLRVTCFGGRACRKAKITANTIHCTQGSRQYKACTGSASLQTECLACGLNGCERHINECRYSILSDEQEDYLKCQPETLQGTCDSQIKKLFHKELSGDEQGTEGEEGA